MIFISYAKEDADYARELFGSLENIGLTPWMDKPPAPWQNRGILVGQNWEDIIEDALQRADYIILLLSTISVAKRGYVRYEFRRALELMSTVPNGEVLVMPVRIDHCSVPRLEVKTISLASLQWEDVPHADITQFVQNIAQAIADGLI